MYTLRPAAARGFNDYGWLQTYHSFSFGSYYEPTAMGFRHLRVLNEDRVQPGQGFHAHGHQNMEILSIVLQGQLQHRDSIGNGSIIETGNIQHMSAGTGIIHSEFNPSATEPLHFLQLWIKPKQRDLTPSYAQQDFASKQQSNQLLLLASPTGQDDSLLIHAEAQLCLGKLEPDKLLQLPVQPYPYAWLQMIQGSCQLDSYTLQAGDGLACHLQGSPPQLRGVQACTFLWCLLA